MMLSHSDLTKTSTGFVLFYALQIARLSVTFSMTLGLAVTFYNFESFCVLGYFWIIHSSETQTQVST